MKTLNRRDKVDKKRDFYRCSSQDLPQSIPSFVLCDRTTSILEAVAEYLRDKKHCSFQQIGDFLHRDAKTVYTSYARAKKKRQKSKNLKDERSYLYKLHNVDIPLSVFHDRTLRTLEVLVAYLKEKNALTYRQISIVLNRDERNIWSVYQNVLKKRKLAELEGGDR